MLWASSRLHIAATLTWALVCTSAAAATDSALVRRWQQEVPADRATRINGLIDNLSKRSTQVGLDGTQPAVYSVIVDPAVVALAYAAPDSVPFLLARLRSRRRVRALFRGDNRQMTLGRAARYILGQLFAAYFQPPQEPPPKPLESWQAPTKGPPSAYARWWQLARVAFRVRRVDTGRYQVDRRWLTSTLAASSKVTRLLRIVPAFDRGQNLGFRLERIRPDSAVARGDLHNGDIVQTINGADLRKPKTPPLLDSQTLVVGLLRNGRRLTIRYDLVDMAAVTRQAAVGKKDPPSEAPVHEARTPRR